MRLADFEGMVHRMADEVPGEFLQGIAEITVSPRTVPHPTRSDTFTLGECIPLPDGAGGGPDAVQSRVVLYHGSFAALARVNGGLDWREEAWETLTHELRHHLEWRARAPDLEELDWAVEQNFARLDGEAFDPTFYLRGEPVSEGLWRVEDDLFVDRVVGEPGDMAEVTWRDRSYRITVPPAATLPAFLILDGIADPPEGELVLVLRRKPGLLDLLRPTTIFSESVRAVPLSYLGSR
jgi:Zincin-like metallopeptidase